MIGGRRTAAVLAATVLALTPAATGCGSADADPAGASSASASPPASGVSAAPSGPPGAAPDPAPSPARSSGSATATTTRVEGIDVSAHQPTVDWTRWAGEGVAFAYIKASEGSTWTNTYFAAQRKGARAVGLYTGSYHYALPGSASGAAQAEHFVDSGGGWTADGRTLPGALDLEQNPRDPADPCYSRTPEQIVAWVRDFTDTYRDLTGRNAVIYVKAPWWKQCAGGDTSFAANPLWLYDHDAPMGPLPAGWTRPTIWQYGIETVDRNVFLGSDADLARWAAGR